MNCIANEPMQANNDEATPTSNDPDDSKDSDFQAKRNCSRPCSCLR